MNSKVVQLHRERNKTIGRPKKPEIKSEAWVKDRVKEIFAQFGNDRPYMPPPALYGSAGASDFIECVYGRYVAIETKRTYSGNCVRSLSIQPISLRLTINRSSDVFPTRSPIPSAQP